MTALKMSHRGDFRVTALGDDGAVTLEEATTFVDPGFSIEDQEPRVNAARYETRSRYAFSLRSLVLDIEFHGVVEFPEGTVAPRRTGQRSRLVGR